MRRCSVSDPPRDRCCEYIAGRRLVERRVECPVLGAHDERAVDRSTRVTDVAWVRLEIAWRPRRDHAASAAAASKSVLTTGAAIRDLAALNKGDVALGSSVTAGVSGGSAEYGLPAGAGPMVHDSIGVGGGRHAVPALGIGAADADDAPRGPSLRRPPDETQASSATWVAAVVAATVTCSSSRLSAASSCRSTSPAMGAPEGLDPEGGSRKPMASMRSSRAVSSTPTPRLRRSQSR